MLLPHLRCPIGPFYVLAMSLTFDSLNLSVSIKHNVNTLKDRSVESVLLRANHGHDLMCCHLKLSKLAVEVTLDWGKRTRLCI